MRNAKHSVNILIIVVCILFSTSISAVEAFDLSVLGVTGYVLSIPDSAEFIIEEVSSEQVQVTAVLPDGAVVFYTTNGKRATEKSLKYERSLVVDLETELHFLTYYPDKNMHKRVTLKIERNAPPFCLIEDDPQLGSLIVLKDSTRFSDLPILFSIVPSFDFQAMDQFSIKKRYDWMEYSSPIDLSEVEYNDFVIAFMIPSTGNSLSSDVVLKEFHTIPGSCFNYVFYDKGDYSEGWRYMEICPIVNEASFGGLGILAGASSQDIGDGLQNTLNIYTAIGDMDETMPHTSYAAKTALESIYVDHDDWYLPSLGELKAAYDAYPELFSLLSDYWTSTERDSEKAYTLRWNRDKDTELKYHVVRRF